MIALAAALLISTNAPAAEVVANCRSMIPADAELKGRIVLRSRRGIVQSEYGYDLVRKSGAKRYYEAGRSLGGPVDAKLEELLK